MEGGLISFDNKIRAGLKKYFSRNTKMARVMKLAS